MSSWQGEENNNNDNNALSQKYRQLTFPAIHYLRKIFTHVYIIILLPGKFFTLVKNLSDSKSLQVSRTLFSILANRNNAVVWIISTCPLISKSSSLFINLLVIVLSAPTTIDITVTVMFPSFFSSLARSQFLSFHLLCFSFTQWSAGTAKSTIWQVLLFIFLSITRSGRLSGIRWSVWNYMYLHIGIIWYIFLWLCRVFF